EFQLTADDLFGYLDREPQNVKLNLGQSSFAKLAGFDQISIELQQRRFDSFVVGLLTSLARRLFGVTRHCFNLRLRFGDQSPRLGDRVDQLALDYSGASG